MPHELRLHVMTIAWYTVELDPFTICIEFVSCLHFSVTSYLLYHQEDLATSRQLLQDTNCRHLFKQREHLQCDHVLSKVIPQLQDKPCGCLMQCSWDDILHLQPEGLLWIMSHHSEIMSQNNVPTQMKVNSECMFLYFHS